MERRFRLRRKSELERVRQTGKSYAHPLIVLIVHKNAVELTRVAVVAGRSVGGAVQRNRAKRRIREVMRPLRTQLRDGYDLMLLARRPILSAAFSEIEQAAKQLCKTAKLMRQE